MDSENKHLVVSIVTPTYNRGHFIEKTIRSIKNQNYPYIEHRVVDGLSRDNTVDILKKHEGTYNLKWVSEKDHGCQNAINKGFKMLTGDIYCWLDSDDYYLPGTIEKVVTIFNNHPEVDVVFGDILYIDNNDKVIDYTKSAGYDFDRLLYMGMNLNPQSMFWRKSLHEKLGSLNEQFVRCADYDFFLRIGVVGAKFYHIREALACYRHHEGQLTGSIDKVKAEWEVIGAQYKNKNLTPADIKNLKRKVLVRQAVTLIMQGDGWFVVRGILKRLNIIKSTI